MMRLRVTIEGPQGSSRSAIAQVLRRFFRTYGITYSYTDCGKSTHLGEEPIIVESLRGAVVEIETQLDAMSKAHAIAFAEAAEKVLAESSKPSFRDAAQSAVSGVKRQLRELIDSLSDEDADRLRAHLRLRSYHTK